MTIVRLILLCCPFVLLARAAFAQDAPSFDALPPCQFTDFAQSQADDNVIVGAVVYNFYTGAGCQENLDVTFPVASVPKLFVAGASYEWIFSQPNTLNLDMSLTFGERYWMGGTTDCLNDSYLNQKIPFYQLIEVMVACSDNSATWMMMDAVGWDAPNQYAERLGIEGLGQIIPYSEVDRLKLSMIDEQWNKVPASLASRYYRAELVTGLDAYFDVLPDYKRREEIRANQLYFDTTTYNTATPRALAEYLVRLNEDSYRDDVQGDVARTVFSAMLLAPRLYSAQAMPGTVSVGGKNGFDYGLVAEVNVIFSVLDGAERHPEAFTIIFSRQKNLSVRNLQRFGGDGTLEVILRQLSPQMVEMLYPNYVHPDMVNTRQLWSALLNRSDVLNRCWQDYANNGYLLEVRATLVDCWATSPVAPLRAGDDIGLGLVLQNLNREDTRVNMVFTAPNGEQRSYQTTRFDRESEALFWYHPTTATDVGTWQVDVYINRGWVFSQTIEVQAK